MLLVILMLLLFPTPQSLNPHVPYLLTWKVGNGQTQEEYNHTTHIAPLGTWFPDLYFNLDKVADIDGMEGGDWRKKQRRVSVSRNGFYACPGFRTGAERQKCGGIESLYCAQWSCVTSNDGEKKMGCEPAAYPPFLC